MAKQSQKICTICGIIKGLSEFQRAKANRDGLKCECKKCSAARDSKRYMENKAHCLKVSRAWQQKNKARFAKKAAEWVRNNPQKVREKYLRHLNSIGFKIKNSQKCKKYQKLHPDRSKVNRSVSTAIKSGKLVRPKVCSKCQKKCYPHGHHENYRKPLDVIWLCASCHVQLHHDKKKFTNKIAI